MDSTPGPPSAVSAVAATAVGRAAATDDASHGGAAGDGLGDHDGPEDDPDAS